MAYRRRRATRARSSYRTRSRVSTRRPRRTTSRRRSVRGRSSARTIRIVVQTQAGPGSASPAAITKSPARVVRARF